MLGDVAACRTAACRCTTCCHIVHLLVSWKKNELRGGKLLKGRDHTFSRYDPGKSLKGLRNVRKDIFKNFHCPSEIEIGTIPNVI